MLFTSIALYCLILLAETQTPVYSQYANPDYIYFADNLPQAVPLSAVPNGLDNDAVRRIFVNEPQKLKDPSTSVEIEKSKEIAFGSSVDHVTNPNKVNIVNRQVSTTMIPSIETAQQIAINRQTPLDRRVLHQTYNRPEMAQTSYNRPETVFKIPQNRPLERPTVPQGAPPSTIVSSTAPVKTGGYNSLLYSVTNFGINLLKNIDAVHTGNVVISPYSITSLLALLQQGAWGQTQEQINNALQMTPAASASAYSQISEDIRNRNSRNILKTANNLFVADSFSINQDFNKIARSSFRSDVTPLSFSIPDQAARQINSWVASRTDNKIERLIAPDALSPMTQIVLVNAIYFKGLWEVPFRVESTMPRDFHLSNGQTKTAQFMRMRKLFKTGMDPTTNAKVTILPFERDQYYLMLILPSQATGMTRTLSSLTDARLLSYLSFSAMDTELEIPKFTVRADTDLQTVLRNMGITSMFGRYAELSGVGTYRSYSPQISSAVHSAVLSIDEQGGSAAAATAFAAVALSYDDPDVVFKADRPFIAVLWDTKSSLPLFMAKIEDPQQ